MVPPQGEEACWLGLTAVDKALSVAGDDFLRNGHMALDCRRTVSMVAACPFFSDWVSWGCQISSKRIEYFLGGFLGELLSLGGFRKMDKNPKIFRLGIGRCSKKLPLFGVGVSSTPKCQP
jgi:hypothetical protein